MLKIGHTPRYHVLFVIVVIGLMIVPPSYAQDPTPSVPPDHPPFSMPFAEPPGPNTWLYEQHYGNTTMAYNYGEDWYGYGQGMHFGVDLEAPCGVPVLAIADGVVTNIDSELFGAGPHNLVIRHTGTGYASLYGHLNQRSPLQQGQIIRRGEPIGESGDPDGSCESRPHLHLEIRSEDYQTTYNPLPFFDVNWHMIASIGPYNHNFQQDLETPYRWMKLEDQPEIKFGGPQLNKYTQPWPPKLEFRAPVNPPPARHLDPLPDSAQVTSAAVSLDAWNIGAWWQANDLDAVYLIDAVPGQAAGVFRQPLDGSPRQYIEAVPPTLYSPNGDVTVRHIGGGNMRVTRLSDNSSWDLYLDGAYPAVSPDGTRLLWEVLYGEVLPGATQPGLAVWVSNLDGNLRRRVFTQSGGWSMWLDSRRLLIVKHIEYTADTQLYILDIDDPAVTPFMLGTFRFLRGLSVAPGGERIAFYLPFQDDPNTSGVYVLETKENAQPRKLDFFGAYQWRDDRSLYALSFDMTQDAHALSVVDVVEGTIRTLTDPTTLPIRIANGDWSVSPDGTRIVYVDPTDYGLYLLTVG